MEKEFYRWLKEMGLKRCIKLLRECKNKLKKGIEDLKEEIEIEISNYEHKKESII